MWWQECLVNIVIILRVKRPDRHLSQNLFGYRGLVGNLHEFQIGLVEHSQHIAPESNYLGVVAEHAVSQQPNADV